MADKNRKVVVTGMGVIAPTGIGADSLFESLSLARSTAKAIESFDASMFPVKSACQVSDFLITDFITPKEAKHMERCSQFGVAAAKMAIKDSGLDLASVDHSRLEIYEGTSIGGMEKIFEDHEILLSKGYQKLHPFTPVRAFVGSTTGEIAINLNVTSRAITLCSGSASATDAIGIGFDRISSGDIDIALAGGSEAPIVPAIVASFSKMGVASTRNGDFSKAYRPFSLDRDGFVLGEGAGFLVLESYEHAKKRGATIYAELSGYGASCDAYHMVMPHNEGQGIRIATERALGSSRVNFDDVDYINAHGTGTELNDKYETAAFKKIFGERASQIAISSTKPITGHLLGACGAIEAIICVLSIRNNFIPPTINYGTPDPECDLDYVPNEPRSKKIHTALSYTYGFGGKNSVLAFGKI